MPLKARKNSNLEPKAENSLFQFSQQENTSCLKAGLFFSPPKRRKPLPSQNPNTYTFSQHSITMFRITRAIGSAPRLTRSIAVRSQGPWIFQDDMSATHAETLDAALAGYLAPPRRPTLAGAPLVPGDHLIFFNHKVAENQLSQDGYDDEQSPVGEYPNRRWYGGRIEFNIDNTLTLGEPAVCTETLASVKSSGNDKRVTVTIDRQMRAEGEEDSWAVREQRTFFYFKNDPALMERQASRHYAPKYTAKMQRIVDPSRFLLFRYSALNFNAHLIHLDKEYTQSHEKLPDVVVQGPLMVTMVLRWVANEILGNGRMVKQFNYRNLAPLIVNERATLCAAPISPDIIEVWIENAQGGMVLTGTIVVA